MKETMLYLTDDNVRAVLHSVNPKTQTRRVVKPRPEVSTHGNLMGEWLKQPLGGLILPKLQDIAIIARMASQVTGCGFARLGAT